MADAINRRSFLLAAPAALTAAALTQHPLMAQTTATPAPAPLPPVDDRTVYFASDYPNIAP